jgi:hypothetical protein
MEYFGVFLILVAAALDLFRRHSGRPPRETPNTPTMRAVYVIPPGAAAVMVAAAGVFIFATSINSR